jgi:hypothetical protein
MAANREACETFSRSFASLYLNDVVGPADAQSRAKYGFDNPKIRITAVLAGNTQEELWVGSEAPLPQGTPAGSADATRAFYATGGLAKNHVVTILESSLQSLRVTKSQLTAPAETKPAPPMSKPAGPESIPVAPIDTKPNSAASNGAESKPKDK